MSPAEAVEINITEDDLAELDRVGRLLRWDRSAFLGGAIQVMSQRQTAEESS